MTRSYAAFVMAAALTVVGCSDTQKSSEPARTPLVAPASRVQTLVGTVEQNTTQRLYPAFILRMDDGTIVGLDGGETSALRSVLGAQIQVDGSMDGDQAFEVSRFLVLAVGGSPVFDGVLEATADGAYTISLTAGGERLIPDAPADLVNYLGQRIWYMVDQGNGDSATFGAIRS